MELIDVDKLLKETKARQLIGAKPSQPFFRKDQISMSFSRDVWPDGSVVVHLSINHDKAEWTGCLWYATQFLSRLGAVYHYFESYPVWWIDGKNYELITHHFFWREGK